MTIQKRTSQPLPVVGEEAVIAIARGIAKKHEISCLERLGISQRLLNLLESEGIKTLETLMHTKKADLLRCKNFGEKQLHILLDALSRYHTLRPEDVDAEL
jgi:DNA-directed RNA polymerase alpha subunit